MASIGALLREERVKRLISYPPDKILAEPNRLRIGVRRGVRYNRRPIVIVARHFLIGGRVQGVGFRFFAEDAARREGLHGYVRNLRDGSVEAEVEGDDEAVERFERAIRRGPAGGRVDDVEVTILTPSGRAGGFEIRP